MKKMRLNLMIRLSFELLQSKFNNHARFVFEVQNADLWKEFCSIHDLKIRLTWSKGPVKKCFHDL